MKFRKDGIVYDTIAEVHEAHCAGRQCSDCALFLQKEMCSDFVKTKPCDAARLMGFEVTDNDVPAKPDYKAEYNRLLNEHKKLCAKLKYMKAAMAKSQEERKILEAKMDAVRMFFW